MPLAGELLEDDEEPPSKERLERSKQRLRQALLRMSRDGSVVMEGTTGNNVRWRLELERAGKA